MNQTDINSETPDLPDRTYDELKSEDSAPVSGNTALTCGEIRRLAGNQPELCMIGDSITWAEEGDWFRRHLLAFLPEIAFAGTHSALLGYSHAGEGGNSTIGVLNRIHDRKRVPDCPYYHLLIGINDTSAAKRKEDIPEIASGIAERIFRIADSLLERPRTQKVFLGSILPGPFEPGTGAPTLRDRAGSMTNEILRKELQLRHPSGRVVWIEYEAPLRQAGTKWKQTLSGAHPNAGGYRLVAGIASPVLRREMKSLPCGTGEEFGVEVTNLWRDEDACSEPLLPGWYAVSFEFEGAGTANFSLPPLSLKFSVPAIPGCRVMAEFMTGYEGYGYTVAPVRLELETGLAKKIQVEKLRPSRRASVYGKGCFIDCTSPISAGEKIVPAAASHASVM